MIQFKGFVFGSFELLTKFKRIINGLRGCPRKNHAKGATAYITDLVHTLHTGITW